MSEQENSGEQALAVAERKAAPYTAVNAHELGLPSPEALNLLNAFATQMQGSIFLPRALAGHSANVLGVVLTGREMGFTPMQSLRVFWVSPDGRLAMYADAMMAAMRQKGFKFPEKEFTAKRAFLKAIRPDGEDYDSEFTWQDAETAKLTGKDNYKHYPKAMLRARVIGEVYRFLAADLGGAQIYTREEIEDLPPGENSTLAPPSEEERKKEQAALTIGVKAEPAAPAPAEAAEAPAPAPEPTGPTTPSESPPPKPEPQGPTAPAEPPVTTIPSSPGKELREAQALPETVEEMFPRLAIRVAGNRKTGGPIIRKFLKGWYGGKPPANQDLFAEPLKALDEFLKDDLNVPTFQEDPVAVSDFLKAAPATAELTKLLTGWQWSPEAQKLALEVAEVRGGLEAEEFSVWMEANQLRRDIDSEVLAFLRVAVRTCEAQKLVEARDKHGISIATLVEHLNQAFQENSQKGIDDVDKRILENALGKLDAMLAESSKSEAPAPQEETPQGSLLDERYDETII